ncbi:unnamed protein product, partial [marine sediment metagenome]
IECFVKAGFGRVSTAEQVRTKGEMVNYLAKTAGTERVCTTTGEVLKMTQLPMAAPKGMRRVRSGKGFLPPKHAKKETGATGVNINEEGRAMRKCTSLVPLPMRDEFPNNRMVAVGKDVVDLSRKVVHIGKAQPMPPPLESEKQLSLNQKNCPSESAAQHKER